MLNKNDILESLLDEVRIVRHLTTKVPADGWTYRPTDGQRNLLEVARYAAFCAIGGTMAAIDGNWEGYSKWCDSTLEATPDQIPGALDRQEEALKDVIGNLSDEDFINKKMKHPLGHELVVGRALLELPLKWMVAYRMQLFLYIKAAGNTEIGTANCWGGIDMPQKAD